MSLFDAQELDGSPTEEVTLQGLSATRRFLVPWESRILFAQALLSQSGPFGLGPASYPGVAFSQVDRISFAPFGDKPPDDPTLDLLNNTNYYDMAVATVTYKTSERPAVEDPEDPDNDLPEGTWATYRQAFSGEFLTVPSRGLTWESDSTAIGPDAKGTILVPITDHIVTWNYVTKPPWGAIGDLRGMVNSLAFRIPVTRRIVPVECLLFEGCESDTEFKFGSDDPLVWKLTYTLKEKIVHVLSRTGASANYGWNHAYREDTGLWDRPKSGADDLYAADDIKKLFTLES